MDSVNPDPSQIPDDDLQLQNYQDDLDTSSSITDPLMTQDDDITEELGVDPKEFKKELDKYDFDEAGHGDDDMREEIESRDMEVQEDVDSRQQ
jgi:serine/threonine protein kinase HipA of HipAB toxin-antitoxin module